MIDRLTAKPLYGDGRKSRTIRPVLFLLLTLFCLSFAYAASDTNYSTLGHSSTFYHTGTGFIPSPSSLVTSTTRAINDPRFVPYVADLDGDGENEIVALSGNAVTLYHESTLSVVDSLSIGSADWAPPVLFDLDGDGYIEILLYNAGASNNITSVEYNGSALYIDNSFSLPTLRPGTINGGSDGFMGCRSDGICGVVNQQVGTSSWKAYGLTTFDSTGFLDQRAIQNLSSTNPICSPFIRHIAIRDFDHDTDDDFIFTGGDLSSVTIAFMRVDPSGIITSSSSVARSYYQPGSIPTSCGTGAFQTDGRRFSSPYVRDIDGASSNGMETIIAVNDDADEFKMYIYKSDGSFLDSHPETAQADGILISNIFSANVFHDTSDGQDYCVAGFASDNNVIDILCGSELTGEVPQTYEFALPLPFNITPTTSLWPHLVHSADQSSSTHTKNSALVGAGFGTINPTEILSTFGILTPDYTDTLCTGALGVHLCELTSLFEPDFVNGSMIGVDVQKTGRNDLLAFSATNIWYIDDGYVNSVCGSSACIDAYTINPCIERTWKQNTTVEARLTVIDGDSDQVAAQLILYPDTINEVASGWSANYSSGVTIVQTIVANTSGTATLRLQARDTFNPSSVESVDLSVNIGATGEVYPSSCTTTASGLLEEAENATTPSTSSEVDNAVRGLTQSASDATGLSEVLIWILFMFVVALGIFIGGIRAGYPITGIVAFVALSETLLLVMGTLLGYLNAGLLISIVVISTVFGLFIIGRKVWGGSPPGG